MNKFFYFLFALLLANSGSQISAQNNVPSRQKSGTLTVSSISFRGNSSFPGDELVSVMKACLGDKWGVYDLRHLSYCAQKNVRGLMFSRGYWQATIGEPQSQITGEKVELSLDVSEGRCYRLGKIKVSGATAFTEKEILEMVGQHTGDIANGTALQDALGDKLKRAYDDKGFVQFSAELEPKFFLRTSTGMKVG